VIHIVTAVLKVAKAPTVSGHLKSDGVASDPVLGLKYIFFFYSCTVAGVVGQPLIEGVYHISKGFVVSDIIKD
jgi:hypothetical protein